MSDRTESIEVTKEQEVILQALAQKEGVSLDDYFEDLVLRFISTHEEREARTPIRAQGLSR